MKCYCWGGVYIYVYSMIWYICSNILELERQVAGGRRAGAWLKKMSEGVPNQQEKGDNKYHHWHRGRKIAKKFDKSTKGGITLSSWCFGDDIGRSPKLEISAKSSVLDRKMLDFCFCFLSTLYAWFSLWPSRVRGFTTYVFAIYTR